MLNRTNRAAASALLLALMLAGCGSDSASPTAPTPVPTPTPAPAPTKSLIAEGGMPSLSPFFIDDAPFTTSTTGDLEIRVQWKSAANHIVVYVARGECPFEELVAEKCNIVVFSESTTPKPRVLTVPGAAAANCVLWIGNLGPREDSPTYTVFLTTGGSASAVQSGLGGVQPTLFDSFAHAPSAQ